MSIFNYARNNNGLDAEMRMVFPDFPRFPRFLQISARFLSPDFSVSLVLIILKDREGITISPRFPGGTLGSRERFECGVMRRTSPDQGT